MQYPSIITKEGAFTLAEFPDCEGCQTFVRKGEDIEESAQEVLEGWLEANLGRDMIPNRPGTVAIRKGADIRQISVPLVLAFRLELRWARAEAKKTQAQFGKNLGMTQQQYARLEGAKSNPTLGTLDRVAKGAGLAVVVTRVTDRSRYDFRRGTGKRLHLVRERPRGGYAVKSSGIRTEGKGSAGSAKSRRVK